MAITKHTILLLAGVLLCSRSLSVEAFSLSNTDYDNLVKPRCFNRSTTTGEELVFGQSVPIGLSIENVISMIERFERLNPTLTPAQVLTTLLKRFHYDGLRLTGNVNSQSNLEYKHSELTRAILADAQSDQLQPFPENQFTEDEKCNLFFSISHVVNTTALKDEEEKYVYWPEPLKTAKAPARNMGNEVVFTTAKPSTPKAVQADFLEGPPSAPAKGKKVQKRQTQITAKTRLTRKPRENGVASFLGSKTNPISVNRVLLGALVGFSNPSDKKISAILEKIRKDKAVDIEDKVVDTLLAVTLSDIYGIDTGEDINNPNVKVIFGGDGQWKSTVCHTQFVLNASEGNWATLAEFRGGLDGYNIGRYLPTLLKEFPSITASQVLRFYYSRQGLSDLDSFCKRNKYFDMLFEDLKSSEALSYLAMWNAVAYDNQHSVERLNFYVNNIRKQFEDTLARAAVRNEDENSLCQGEFNNDIRSKPVESTVDAVFVLDITRKCTQDVECNQAVYVSSLAQKLKLGRGLGSASVLFNARGVENPTLVDEDMKPVVTPLYSVLYNSTSNECPGCKSANYDGASVDQISDRVEFLQMINTTLDNFEQSRSNELGVPGKALFWFDFGTVKPIPSDKIQAVKYEQVKRVLLHVQRDWTWFGLAVNTTNLKDMVWEDGNLVSVDSNTAAIPNSVRQLSQKVSEVPSVFQYTDCKRRASVNVTYEGLITPGYKQYYAIYPDTFRSSARIDLKFKADGGAIEVCYNKAPKPEMKSESCKKAASAKDEVVFTVPYPCRDVLFEKCPPLYFTIAVDNSVTAHCTEPRCTNIDQVKWRLSHTGISCNRASAASISLLFIAITTIVSFAFNKHTSY